MHPKPIFCPTKEIKTGYQSEIYKNLLAVKISNEDRNPKESSDYSLEVDFTVKGENADAYTVRLKIGKEYCYEGKTEDALLNDFLQKLDSFAESLYKI